MYLRRQRNSSLPRRRCFDVEYVDYVDSPYSLRSNLFIRMANKEPTPENMRPGFCSATCTDRASLQQEIQKNEPKTSDFFATCNLPKRFEHPHWFNGYGCQVSKQHPFYRTSASVYGWYAPGIHSVPSVFFPAGQTFTNRLSAAGMYRNYSLNTGMDPVGYS